MTLNTASNLVHYALSFLLNILKLIILETH